MKRGNQFYLEVQILDDENNVLDVSSVKKVQFNINKLTKTFDGVSEEVSYDNEKQCFNIWLTESETFEFRNDVKIDARVLFVNDVIMGTIINQEYIFDSLKEVLLDDEVEDTE